MAKPSNMPFMRKPQQAPGLLPTQDLMGGGGSLMPSGDLMGSTGSLLGGSGDLTTQSGSYTPPPTTEESDVVKDMRRAGMLTTQSEIDSELEARRAREERAWGWDALAMISQLSGAEMVKGTIAGAAEGGVGGAITRGLRGNPIAFLLDYLTPDAIMPAWTKSRETTATELRQAFDPGAEASLGKDLGLEIALDPSTYLLLGSTAAIKVATASAMRAGMSAATAAARVKSAANVAKHTSRAVRAAEGSWYVASIGIPFVKSSKIPLSTLLPGGKNGIHAMDLAAAKAIDAVGDSILKIPGIQGVRKLVTRAPNLASAKAGQQIDAQRIHQKTMLAVQNQFFVMFSNLPPSVQTQLKTDPEFARVFTDLTELGIEKMDNKGMIVDFFNTHDSAIATQLRDELLTADPTFKKHWDIATDPAKLRTQEWVDSLQTIYRDYDTVQLELPWLREAKLAPRFGHDILARNYAELSDALKAEFDARGFDPTLFANLTPEQLQRLNVARDVGDETLKRIGAMRTNRIDAFTSMYDRLAAGGAGALQDVEAALGVSRKYLNGIRDAEIAAGIIDDTMTKYFPRIATPEGRKLMQEHAEGFALRAHGTNSPVYGFMRQRKLDDTILTTEYNSWMSLASANLRDKIDVLKDAGLTQAKYDELVTQYGQVNAAAHVVFNNKFKKSMRALGETDMVDFFHANPVGAYLLRSQQSSVKQAGAAFTEAMYHADSAYVHGVANTQDSGAVNALMAQAAASQGSIRPLVVVTEIKGVAQSVDTDKIRRGLASLDIRAETVLHRTAVEKAALEALDAETTTFTAIRDGIAEAVARVRDNGYAPGSALTDNAALKPMVEQLRRTSEQIAKIDSEIAEIRTAQGALVKGATADPLQAVTGTATQNARKRMEAYFTPEGTPIAGAVESNSEYVSRVSVGTGKAVYEAVRKEQKAVLEQVKKSGLPAGQTTKPLAGVELDKYIKELKTRQRADLVKKLEEGTPRLHAEGAAPLGNVEHVNYSNLAQDSRVADYLRRGNELAGIATDEMDEFSMLTSRLDILQRSLRTVEYGATPTARMHADEIRAAIASNDVTIADTVDLDDYLKAEETAPFLVKGVGESTLKNTEAYKKFAATVQGDIADIEERLAVLGPRVHGSRVAKKQLQTLRVQLEGLDAELANTDELLKIFPESVEHQDQLAALGKIRDEVTTALTGAFNDARQSGMVGYRNVTELIDIGKIEATVAQRGVEIGVVSEEAEGFRNLLYGEQAALSVDTVDDTLLARLDPAYIASAGRRKVVPGITPAGNAKRRIDYIDNLLTESKSSAKASGKVLTPEQTRQLVEHRIKLVALDADYRVYNRLQHHQKLLEDATRMAADFSGGDPRSVARLARVVQHRATELYRVSLEVSGKPVPQAGNAISAASAFSEARILSDPIQSRIVAAVTEMQGTSTVHTVANVNSIVASKLGNTHPSARTLERYSSLNTPAEILDRIKQVRTVLLGNVEKTVAAAGRKSIIFSETEAGVLNAHLQQLKKLKRLNKDRSRLQRFNRVDNKHLQRLAEQTELGELVPTKAPGGLVSAGLKGPQSVLDPSSTVAQRLQAVEDGVKPTVRIYPQSAGPRFRAQHAAEVAAGESGISPYVAGRLASQRVRLGPDGRNAMSLMDSDIAAKRYSMAQAIASREQYIEALQNFSADAQATFTVAKDSIFAGKREAKELLHSRKLSASTLDTHAHTMLRVKAQGGMLAIDQLDETQRAALLSGKADSTLKLVDAEAFHEGNRFLEDINAPDSLRKYSIVRAADAFHGWWKPYTAAGMMFLGSRARDATQNLTTLGATGLVTVDGTNQARKIMLGIRKALHEGKPIGHYVPKTIYKYVDESGNVVVDKTLQDLVQDLQGRGIIGYNLVRDEFLQTAEDAARFLPGGKGAGAKEWILGAFNAVPTASNPWVRKGVKLTSDLDDASRLVGVFSGLSRGMDINTAVEMTRAATYGTHGNLAPKYVKAASRFIPFFQYQDWAVRTAMKQARGNPAFLTTHNKIRDAFANHPLMEEGVEGRDNTKLNQVLPKFLKAGYNIPYMHTPEGLRYLNAGNLVAAETLIGWVNRVGMALDGDGSELGRDIYNRMSPLVKGASQVVSNIVGRDNLNGREPMDAAFGLTGKAIDDSLGVPLGSGMVQAIKTIRAADQLDKLNLLNLPALFKTGASAGIGSGAVLRDSTPEAEPSLTEKLFSSAFMPLPLGSIATVDVQASINKERSDIIKNWQLLTTTTQNARARVQKYGGDMVPKDIDRLAANKAAIPGILGSIKDLEALDKLYRSPDHKRNKPDTNTRYSYNKYFRQFKRG